MPAIIIALVIAVLLGLSFLWDRRTRRQGRETNPNDAWQRTTEAKRDAHARQTPLGRAYGDQSWTDFSRRNSNPRRPG